MAKKYVENPAFTSKALFEELFNRKKVLLRDRGDLRFEDEIQEVNNKIVELVQQEIAAQPEPQPVVVQPVPQPEPVVEPEPAPVVEEPVVVEKPKRAPYSGIGPKAYHISQLKNGSWQIKATGEKAPLITFKEFERIVGFSKVLADKNGATVRLHDAEGRMTTIY